MLNNKVQSIVSVSTAIWVWSKGRSCSLCSTNFMLLFLWREF